MAERDDVVVGVSRVGRVGRALVDRDREVHAGHVGGADEHAGIGRDLAKETGVPVDVGFNIGVEIRLVDFRKA